MQGIWTWDQDWHLPSLWIPEFRHILLKYLRSGAILPDEALIILADANAQFEVGAFYWTVPAPDIVNPGREEQGSVSV